jgi:hypothetical protein
VGFGLQPSLRSGHLHQLPICRLLTGVWVRQTNLGSECVTCIGPQNTLSGKSWRNDWGDHKL